jgi:hypothetical protein
MVVGAALGVTGGFRSRAETAAANDPRNVELRKSCPTEASRQYEANPKLEHLFDQMIAEAADS